MAKDLNQCNFIGRLGKDPDLRSMPNGKPVATINIAVSDDYKDASGNKVQRTNWIPAVAYDKLAEIIGQYLQKGSKVFIGGKLTNKEWTDQQGNKKSMAEIIISDLQMLDSRQDGAQGGQHATPAYQQPAHQAARQAQEYAQQTGGRMQQPAPPPDAFDDFDQYIPF